MTALQVGGKGIWQAGAGDFCRGGCDIVIDAAEGECGAFLIVQAVGGAVVEVARLTNGTGIDEVAARGIQLKGEASRRIINERYGAYFPILFAEDGGAVRMPEEADVC